MALVLIALLTFLFLRRRRRRGHLAAPMLDPECRKPKLGDNGDSTMLGVRHPPGEMQGLNHPSEMPQREVTISELPSEERPKEAAGWSLYEM